MAAPENAFLRRNRRSSVTGFSQGIYLKNRQDFNSDHVAAGHSQLNMRSSSDEN
jgi:hypothetical protein